MTEISRVNAALAAAFTHSEASDLKPGRTLDYGAQFTAGRTTVQTTYGPAAPDLFPNRGFTIKAH